MSPTRPRSTALVPALLLLLVPVLPAQLQEVTDTYVNGNIRTRYCIDAKGNKSGAYVGYFRDGKVSVRANYRENILYGRYESYYRNGKRHVYTSYKDGKLHGKHEEYSKDQTRVVTAHYQDGVLHGSFDVTDNGKVLTRQVWKKGELCQLNGMQPFPRSLGEIQAQLRLILREPPAVQGTAPGTAPGTEPGTRPGTRQDSRQDRQLPRRLAALRRLKAYRYLCHVPWQEMALDPSFNELCDAAAEVCRRIGRLDHHPPRPDGMDEETYRKGCRGASHSNLSAGSGMVRSVDSYMDDSDASNIDRVGHRRWCLNPAMRKTGFGESGNYSAMWSHDASGGGAGGQAAIYYPPRGFVPIDFFGPRHAFSISIIKGGQARKDELAIRIQPLDEQYLPQGEPLELDYLNVTNGGAGIPHCLIFRPKGLQVAPGRRYWVEVSYDKGRTRAHEYLVEFVDVVKAVGN